VCDKNELHQTALHLAIEHKLAESLVEILLNAIKVDFVKKNLPQSFGNWLAGTFIDSKGETPLHYAAGTNNLSLCLLLISFGFDTNQKSLSGQCAHDLSSKENVRMALYGTVLYALWLKHHLIAALFLSTYRFAF
jgi:ankyrin repeat protein